MARGRRSAEAMSRCMSPSPRGGNSLRNSWRRSPSCAPSPALSTAGRCAATTTAFRVSTASATAGTTPAFLFAFDLIELNGDDLRRDPLEVSNATLASVLAKASPGLRLNAHIEAYGLTVVRSRLQDGNGGDRADTTCRRSICLVGARRRGPVC
jgi:hypothetical protein